MEPILLTIILLGIPALVAHILTLLLLWDCRKNGHLFAATAGAWAHAARDTHTGLEHYLVEIVKIAADLADAVEVIADAPVTSGAHAPQVGGIDPREVIMGTIQSLIMSRMGLGESHAQTSSEREVHVIQEETSPNDSDEQQS